MTDAWSRRADRPAAAYNRAVPGRSLRLAAGGGLAGLLLAGACNVLLGIDPEVEILCESGDVCPTGFCKTEAQTCDTRQWARSFSGPGRDEATDLVHVDLDGDGPEPGWTVVVGSFSRTLDFGDGFVLESEDDRDTFIAALDSEGRTQWVTSFGGEGDQEAVAVAVSTSGAIYVTGTFEGEAEFAGDTLRAASGLEEGFMLKLDAEGDPRWAHRFGGTRELAVQDIVIVENGQPTAVGSSRGLWESGPNETGSADDISSAYLVTYSADGKQAQAFSVFAMEGNAVACCARVDPLTDNILLGGTITTDEAMASFIVVYFENEEGETEWTSETFELPLEAFNTDSLARVAIAWTGAMGLPEPGLAVGRLEEEAGPLVRGEASSGDVTVEGLVHDSANDTIAFGRFRDRLRLVEGPTFESDDWDLYLLTVDEDFTLPPGRSRAFTGEGDASPGGVDTDAEDRVVFAGSFDGELEIHSDDGAFILDAGDSTDVFVAQIEL